MNFEELGLPAPLIAGLAAQGITAPTPVQQRAIPLLLEGKDALIQSETGTGKTLAYLLPFLAREEPDGRLLVLTPRGSWPCRCIGRWSCWQKTRGCR